MHHSIHLNLYPFFPWFTSTAYRASESSPLEPAHQNTLITTPRPPYHETFTTHRSTVHRPFTAVHPTHLRTHQPHRVMHDTPCQHPLISALEYLLSTSHKYPPRPPSHPIITPTSTAPVNPRVTPHRPYPPANRPFPHLVVPPLLRQNDLPHAPHT